MTLLKLVTIICNKIHIYVMSAPDQNLNTAFLRNEFSEVQNEGGKVSSIN